MEGEPVYCTEVHGERALICPVCGIEMIAVERSGVELDSCISCRGLWFDGGELELLAEMSGADLSAFGLGATTGVASRRRCPRCRKRLDEVAQGSLRIDRCPGGDGFWFDRGELGTIVERGLAATGALAKVSQFLGEVFAARQADGQKQEQEGTRP